MRAHRHKLAARPRAKANAAAAAAAGAAVGAAAGLILVCDVLRMTISQRPAAVPAACHQPAAHLHFYSRAAQCVCVRCRAVSCVSGYARLASSRSYYFCLAVFLEHCNTSTSVPPSGIVYTTPVVSHPLRLSRSVSPRAHTRSCDARNTTRTPFPSFRPPTIVRWHAHYTLKQHSGHQNCSTRGESCG